MIGRGLRDSFVGTLIESIPRLALLVSHMRPTWHLPSIAALDPAFVERHGIRGLIWDVDGTLTHHHASVLAAEASDPFRALLQVPGLGHVILSNANESRFNELPRVFPTVPVLRGYRTGSEVEFRRLEGAGDSWSPDEVRARLAAQPIPLRKPSAELVHRAVELLGCAPTEVVMVGDQYLTDAAGAGLAGIRSIKVPTIARSSFPVPVRLSQLFETALFRVRHGKAGR